jgi:hypothetical protein
MNTIRIHIVVENAEGWRDGHEIARILTRLADQYAYSGRIDVAPQVRDSNGNLVGEALLAPDPYPTNFTKIVPRIPAGRS